MTLAFTCASDVLRRLVERMGNVVEKNTTIPILANLLIASTDDGRLTITGTDLDLTAVATSTAEEVKIEASGATTIPSRILHDMLKKTGQAATVSFASSGSLATIKAGRATFNLHQLPADDFPDLKATLSGSRLSLTPPQLRRIHSSCGFAVSRDEARYYLNGVFLHVAPSAPGLLTCVATDGHRLSLLRQEVAGDLAALPAVIVPRKTVDLFPLIADAAGGLPVEMEIGTERISFEAGELRVVAKLIDGTFPDYQRVIPARHDHLVQLHRTRLAAAIERVETVSAERGSAMKFAFSPGTLALTMTSPDAGDGYDAIEIEGSAEIAIGFNARYALAALGSFETHGIEIALQDPASPALMRAPGDDNRLVVLMPMRV